MSGVFGQTFGRKNSDTGGWVSSWKYSVSSCLWVRHVKYVYDWLNPTLASRYITFGRVNASARNSASGWAPFSSPRAHSQNGNALVCGLSTRKISTPWPIQNSKIEHNSCHRACQSSDSKSNG